MRWSADIRTRGLVILPSEVMVPNLCTPAKLELSAHLQQEEGRVEQMNFTKKFQNE